MRRLLSSMLLLTVACSLGGYSGGPGDVNTGPDGGPIGGGGVVPGDLPCDVATLLSARCTSCHGTPPSSSAPMALDSHAALTALSATFAGQTEAQRSLVRMQDAASPMPPGAGVTVPAADIAVFASWVDAGTPTGSCAPAQDPAFSAPPKCSSNSYWTNGDEGSSQMQPGLACIACHSRGEGPTFAIAGTVYPTGHEFDACNGTAAAGATVTVTDQNGVSHSFGVNGAGNFYSNAGGGWPAFPITATVNFGGKTRSMATAVPSGDCNTCHTQNGTAVGGIAAPPGRIALP